jgi:hypothetical protein
MNAADRALYDEVLAKAVADAYDRGYAAGKEIGFDVGFLTAARAANAMNWKEGGENGAGPTLPASV